jgi:sporulation-control protein spo0M
MDREFIQRVVDEARSEEANLVIWDRRDTFTIEQGELENLEIGDGHLRARMQDGKVTVYVQLDKIYKLVVEKERARRPGVRAGFGAPGS